MTAQPEVPAWHTIFALQATASMDVTPGADDDSKPQDTEGVA